MTKDIISDEEFIKIYKKQTLYYIILDFFIIIMGISASRINLIQPVMIVVFLIVIRMFLKKFISISFKRNKAYKTKYDDLFQTDLQEIKAISKITGIVLPIIIVLGFISLIIFGFYLTYSFTESWLKVWLYFEALRITLNLRDYIHPETIFD